MSPGRRADGLGSTRGGVSRIQREPDDRSPDYYRENMCFWRVSWKGAGFAREQARSKARLGVVCRSIAWLKRRLVRSGYGEGRSCVWVR